MSRIKNFFTKLGNKEISFETAMVLGIAISNLVGFIFGIAIGLLF